MTDFAPQYALGEDIDGDFNGGSRKMPVTYTETIVPGKGLTITGNGQGVDNVDVDLTDNNADLSRFIAILDGDDGDVKEALQEGRTKVEFGGTVTAGNAISIDLNGDVINHTTNQIVGFALQSGVDGDLGLVYFYGAVGTT